MTLRSISIFGWSPARPPASRQQPAVRRSTPSSIPCCDRGRSRSDLQGSTLQMPRSPTAKFAVRSVSHRKFGVFPCGYFFSRTATSASSSQIGKHKKDYRSKRRLHIRVSRRTGIPPWAHIIGPHRNLSLPSSFPFNFSVTLFPYLLPAMAPPRFTPWTPEEDKLLIEAVAACECFHTR